MPTYESVYNDGYTQLTAQISSTATFRQIISASALLGKADHIHVVFFPHNSVDIVLRAWIGLQATSGDAWDIDASTIVQLTKDGSTGISVPKQTVTTTDTVLLNVDKTRNLVLSVDRTSGGQPVAAPLPTGLSLYRSDTANNHAADASGFYAYNYYAIFKAIEGYETRPERTPVNSLLVHTWHVMEDAHISLLDQPWGIKFGADLAQAWSDTPVVRGMLSQPWGNAQPIRSQLVQRWQDMVALRAQLDQPWAIMESLLVALAQPWAITSGPVQALLDQGWSIQDIEPVMSMLHQPWAIAADGSVLRYQVEVLANGQLVRTSHVNIEGGLDGDVLTCEIHPETEAEYLLCPYGADLVVTVTSQEGTDTFSFVVIEPRIAEEHGKTEYVVVAMSQAVLLGEPYADGQGGELSGLASEIAAVLAAPVPVSWETVDWTIPAGVWIASGETPLALLKTLAAAVGAVVQADPDGTLAIRPKYRIPLPNFDQAAVDLELTEILDCFSTGDTPDHRSGYNRYLVGNQSASSDTGLTLEQTDVSVKVKEVRAYQVPWAGDFELTHTGGPWVVIEPMGIEEREETETVEFVAGAGKTKFPIYGLVTMEWQRVNLGTVTTAEDSGLAADISGQSLLTITYTTRCKLWRVHDLKSEQLQLVAEL